MMKIDDLCALTKNEVTVKDKKKVTLALALHEPVETTIHALEEYFGRREKQQAIRLVLGDEDRGYLLRADLYKMSSLGTRGIGDSDGATLPGGPSSVKLIELCCPTVGCPQVLLVTRYDENDPPTCNEHGTAMERC